MHYLINECLIKSENAALSSNQKNKNITKFIGELPQMNTILDYGCGKCRYSILLSEKCISLYLTDSEVQINRLQTIYGKKTTVKEYVENELPNSKVIELENIENINTLFDFVLCTNVLSAIPFYEERLKVLSNIYELLKENGKALISVQYKNSYFNTYLTNPNAVELNGGWLIKIRNSYSYYAIITPNELVSMCQNAGFKIEKKIVKDGSVYVFVDKSL